MKNIASLFNATGTTTFEGVTTRLVPGFICITNSVWIILVRVIVSSRFPSNSLTTY